MIRSFLWLNLLASLGAAFVPLQSTSSVLTNPIENGNSALLATTKGGKEKGSKSWEQRWDDNYESLKAFQEKFGHTRVPRKDDQKLANWVTIQQENFLLGVMRQDRMERLSALGFNATSSTTSSSNSDDSAINPITDNKKDDGVEKRRPEGSSSSSSSSWERRWEEMYQKLKTFKEKSGHTSIRSSDDPKLVNWVQIQQENLRRGIMREDRKVKLEDIGVVAQKTDLLDSVAKAFGDEDIVDSVSKAYTTNINIKEQRSATARHILVQSEDDVQTVLKALEECGGGGGESSTFSQLAEQYSTCPSGKQSGGRLGSFPPGKMVPEFDKVIFDKDSKLGEVLGPVQTLFGYHLIMIEKRTGV